MDVSQSPRSRKRRNGGKGRSKVVHFPTESVDECLSFQYTVDDSAINSAAANATTAAAANHDNPEATAAEATCAFQYFVPSPSPTGPSCSLRLSCGTGTAEVGVNSSRISSPAAMAGRRLEYIERMDDNAETTKAATVASEVSEPRSARVVGIRETGRKDSRKPTVPVASSSVSVREGATTSTAAEAPAHTCRQPRATNSHSKGHLFATLMDNIDLSQMTPSQPMQEKDGAGDAMRGEKGLGGQALAVETAVSATTTESERMKSGGVLGQLQSRNQPESCERHGGPRSSSSSPRHVRNQAEGSSSPTPLVAPLTAGFRDGLWSKSAVGAADTLALRSDDITCRILPYIHPLTLNKSKSLKTPPPENPRPLPLQPPNKEKTNASETAAKTKASTFRDRLLPQKLPTSMAGIGYGVSTSNAVEAAVSVTEEGGEAAGAGLVDEAKHSRMPPPLRRRFIGGEAAPVVAPIDLTDEPWMGRRLGFSSAPVPNADTGKADEQHAGLETETTLEREAVQGVGIVAREMSCVGTVARLRDSVDSTARDGSPSSSCMSSLFNLDLVTTPETQSHGRNAADRPESTDRYIQAPHPTPPTLPLTRGQSSRPARGSAESSRSSFCLALSSSPSQPSRSSGGSARRSPSETTRSGSGRRRTSTSSVNSSTDKSIHRSGSDRDMNSNSPWSLTLFSSAEVSPSTLLEEGRSEDPDVTATRVPLVVYNENRKMVECSRRPVDNHEHVPDATDDIADAKAKTVSGAILEVLSPPLVFEDAAGSSGDTTVKDKALSRGVSSVGDPHDERLRKSEINVAVPPPRCPASNKEQPVPTEETVAALRDRNGAEVSVRKPERQEVGAPPYQVNRQNGEEEEEDEEETEDVPQNSVIVHVDTSGARRDGSLNSRQRDPLIVAQNTKGSSEGNKRNSHDGVSLHIPSEESRAEHIKAATISIARGGGEGERGVLQISSKCRRDAATITSPQSSSTSDNTPAVGISVGGGARVRSTAAELAPAVTDKNAPPPSDDREHKVESKHICDISTVARGGNESIAAKLGANELASPILNNGIHTRVDKNTSKASEIATAAKTASAELTCLADDQPRTKVVSAREVLVSDGTTTLTYSMKVKGVRDDDSDNESVFNEGAARRGRTNWAAAVYGREESLVYPREEKSVDGSAVDRAASARRGLDGVAVLPGPASTSGSVRVKERENVSAEVAGGGPNPATGSPARTAATLEGNPLLVKRGCGETGRAGSVVRPLAYLEKKKREPGQMVSCAKQVVFTSEEESLSSMSEGWTVLQGLRSSPVPSFPWESPPENAQRWGSKPNLGTSCAASSGRTAPAPSVLLPVVKGGATAEAEAESNRITSVTKESKLCSKAKAGEAKSVLEASVAGESCPCPSALPAAAVVTTGAAAVGTKGIKAFGDSSSRGGERVLVSGASDVDQTAVDGPKVREEIGADIMKPPYFNTATVRPVQEMALTSSEGRSFSSGKHEDVDCASSPERPRHATMLEADERSTDTDIDTEIDSDGSPPGLRRPGSGGESGTTATASAFSVASVAGEEVRRAAFPPPSSAAAEAASTTVPLVRCRGSNENIEAASVEEGRRQSETGDISTLEDMEERKRNVESAANSLGQGRRKQSHDSSAGNEDVSVRVSKPQNVNENAFSLHQNQPAPYWEDTLDDIEETPPADAVRPKKRLKARNLSVEDKAVDLSSLGKYDDDDDDADPVEVEDCFNGDDDGADGDGEGSETRTITDGPAVDPDDADPEYAHEGGNGCGRDHRNQDLLPWEDLSVLSSMSLPALAAGEGEGKGEGEAVPEAGKEGDACSEPSLRDVEAADERSEDDDSDHRCCSDSETLIDVPSPSRSDLATPPQLTQQQQSKGDILSSPPVLSSAAAAAVVLAAVALRGVEAGGATSGDRPTDGKLAMGDVSVEAREVRGEGEGRGEALEAPVEAIEESDDDVDSVSTLEEAGAGADDVGCGEEGKRHGEGTSGAGTKDAVADSNASGLAISLSVEMKEKAARLAALSRFTAGRDKKARLLIAELKRARNTEGQQAEIQRILKELVALRAETFRYHPKPDAGGSGSVGFSSSRALTLSSPSPPVSKEPSDSKGEKHVSEEDPIGSGDVSLSTSTLRSCLKTRNTPGATKEQCSSPVSREVEVEVARKGKRRQQRRRHPSVIWSTNGGGDFGDAEEVRQQERVAQSKSTVASTGSAEGETSVACPPAPDTSNASGNCGRDPKRAATSSLPCARDLKGSSNITAIDVARPTCLDSLVNDRGKSRCHPARGIPTADDLNDPIFRAKMKARVKANTTKVGAEIAISGDDNGGGGGGDGSISGGGICATASRSSCGRKVGDSNGVSRVTEVEGGDEAGRVFGRWISSWRDWCVGDVSDRRASSGAKKGSSSKQQLSSRSKASSASAVPSSSRKKKNVRRKSTPLSAASRSGVRCSSRRSVEAPRRSASVENGAAVTASGFSARCDVDFGAQPRGGKGVKRARSDDDAERNFDRNGSGRVEDRAAVAGVGVGPRSHAKRRRYDGVVQKRGKDCASVYSGIEETTVELGKVISPPGDHLHSARGALKKASSATREIARTCPRRSGTPTREERIHSASAATSVSRAGWRQRHVSDGGGGSGGRARGQEMVRQARDRGDTADRRAAGESTEGLEQDAVNKIIFRGFRFVLVGLSVNAGKEVEKKILAGGGALIDEIPSNPQGELSVPMAGRGKGIAAAVAMNSSRRKVKPEEEVNVVVVVSLLAASREPEYVLAVATGIPLVHRLWVDDSTAQGQPLPAGPYLLQGAREAPRRRQVVGSDRRRLKNGGSMVAGAARLATARVVTKPGTPLMGMKVGVAHPSPHTCERWGRVITAAGAQVVRLISAPLLLMDGELSTELPVGVALKARSRRTAVVDSRISSGHKTSGFGVEGKEPVRTAPAPALTAAFVGLDCVVCDYPEVWRGNLWGGSGTLALERARSPSCRRTELQTHGGNAMLMLERLVVAATREGVRLVSLSWLIDCAVRGTRIKQQSRPEYLSPFLDVSLGGREPLRIAVGAGSAVKPRPPVTAVAAGIHPTPLRAFLSITGERYEVNDFVRYSAREDNFAGSGSGRSSSRGQEDPLGRDDRVGRIVSLEMTPSGRVFVTLEPFREKQRVCSSSSSTFSTVVGMDTNLSETVRDNGAFMRRGKRGVFTRPSKESSVVRGRERRACELMKVAAKGNTEDSYGIHKMEATCLRIRVCVVTTKEFKSRGGYCGRDPDVYVHRKALSA